MKRKQKGLLVSLVLAAAGLTVGLAAAGRQQVSAGAEAGRAAPAAEEGSPSSAGMPAPQGVNRLVGGAVNMPDPASEDRAPPAESEGEPAPLPADLKVTVRDTPAGRSVRVARQGHLIAVRRGAERRVGMHEVNMPVDGGDALVWESTGPRTLETLRGRLSVGADGAFAMENTVHAAVVAEDARGSGAGGPMHLCRGHADGAGGFVVVCRVDGAAAAASVDGSEPREGVWSLAGQSTLVRFDLPMSGDGASARVLGYEKGGTGVLVRAEASRAPGEPAAVLALGSGARAQPEPVRPIRVCHLPPRDL